MGTELDVKKLSLLNYCNQDSDLPQKRETHNIMISDVVNLWLL